MRDFIRTYLRLVSALLVASAASLINPNVALAADEPTLTGTQESCLKAFVAEKTGDPRPFTSMGAFQSSFYAFYVADGKADAKVCEHAEKKAEQVAFRKEIYAFVARAHTVDRWLFTLGDKIAVALHERTTADLPSAQDEWTKLSNLERYRQNAELQDPKRGLPWAASKGFPWYTSEAEGEDPDGDGPETAEKVTVGALATFQSYKDDDWDTFFSEDIGEVRLAVLRALFRSPPGKRGSALDGRGGGSGTAVNLKDLQDKVKAHDTRLTTLEERKCAPPCKAEPKGEEPKEK